MVSVGDTVRLSNTILTFVKDFRGDGEYQSSRDTVMLVIDIDDTDTSVTVLSPYGEVIVLEKSDVEVFSKIPQKERKNRAI